MGHMKFAQSAPGLTGEDIEMVNRAILDLIPDGVLICDSLANVVFANLALARMMGCSPSEVLGQPLTALPIRAMPPLAFTAAGFQNPYRADGANGPHRSAVRLFPKSGAPLDGELTAYRLSAAALQVFVLRETPGRAADGARGRPAPALSDVTNDISAALAHELNQPMTALMLYLQTVKASLGYEPNPTAGRGELIDKALREAERAVAIIQRMRQFSARKSGRRRVIDLTALIDDAIELALAGSSAHIGITKSVQQDLPEFIGDPVQITQVLVNLLKNAVEAMPDGRPPEIAIHVLATDGCLHITVSDNGSGIPMETERALFQAFASTGKSSGLGIGLAISRAIAQEHGGNLVLARNSAENGAAFTLVLPLTITHLDFSARRGVH